MNITVIFLSYELFPQADQQDQRGLLPEAPQSPKRNETPPVLENSKTSPATDNVEIPLTIKTRY